MSLVSFAVTVRIRRWRDGTWRIAVTFGHLADVADVWFRFFSEVHPQQPSSIAGSFLSYVIGHWW